MYCLLRISCIVIAINHLPQVAICRNLQSHLLIECLLRKQGPWLLQLQRLLVIPRLNAYKRVQYENTHDMASSYRRNRREGNSINQNCLLAVCDHQFTCPPALMSCDRLVTCPLALCCDLVMTWILAIDS